LKAGMKFDYEVYSQTDEKLLTTGYTKHAFMDPQGRVVRPPKFLRELIQNHIQTNLVPPIINIKYILSNMISSNNAYRAAGFF
jgi:hypothetical protein